MTVLRAREDSATRDDSARTGIGLAGLRNLAGRAENLWIALVLLGLIVMFTVWAPPGTFLTGGNLSNIALDASQLLILSTGVALLIIAGGLDLSVGAVVVFSAVVAGKTVLAIAGPVDQTATMSVPQLLPALLAGLAAAVVSGCAWGALNAFVILRLRVPSIIATLATLSVATGLAQIVSNGVNVTSLPIQLQQHFGGAKAFGVIPWPVVVALIVLGLLWTVLAQTRFGLRTYAIGSNRDAAARAGVPVARHMLTLYILVGLLAGLVAFVDLSRFGTASLAGHTQDALNAIAAVVIGGVSLFGGRGRMFGVVIGVLIPAVLANGFVVVRVDPFWQNVAVGAVLILAVYIDQLRRGANTKRRVGLIMRHTMRGRTRRGSVAALGMVLALSLAACGSDTESTSPSAEPTGADDQVSVTLALAVQSGCPFCISIQRGAEAAAEELGVDLTVVSPPTPDTASQISQLNGILANNPDVLVLQPFDPAALLPVVEQFADKGTPTITVDTDLGDPEARLALISSDNQAGGKFAAEQLAERIGERGKVLYVGYDPGLAGTDARRAGFEEQIKTYPEIEYLGAQYSADDQSVTAGQVNATLRAHDDLAGIFAGAESHAIGTAAALREAGKAGDVQVVAFDGAPDEVQALKDGVLSLLVVQKAYEMGELAIEQAVAYARDGEEPDGDTFPEYVAVTQDNIDDPDISKYLYPTE